MKLITKQLEQKFKKHPLYSQEEAEDPVAIAKYFLPFGRGTWYVIEAQKETDGDYYFFGYVESPIDPLFDEYGYFTLKQLEEIRTPFGGIERDFFLKELKNYGLQDNT